MDAWLTLDFVSKRYGKLPSEVMKSGSSLDVQCASLAIQYEAYVNKKAQDKEEGKVGTGDYTTEQLQSMISATRGKSKEEIRASMREQNENKTKTKIKSNRS